MELIMICRQVSSDLSSADVNCHQEVKRLSSRGKFAPLSCAGHARLDHLHNLTTAHGRINSTNKEIVSNGPPESICSTARILLPGLTHSRSEPADVGRRGPGTVNAVLSGDSHGDRDGTRRYWNGTALYIRPCHWIEGVGNAGATTGPRSKKAG